MANNSRKVELSATRKEKGPLCFVVKEMTQIAVSKFLYNGFISPPSDLYA